MVRKMSACLLDLCDMLLNDRALRFEFENVEAVQMWERRVLGYQ